MEAAPLGLPYCMPVLLLKGIFSSHWGAKVAAGGGILMPPNRAEDLKSRHFHKVSDLSETQSTKIRCESCGAKYRWSEKLAGKRVKCKCGQVLSFPRTPDGGAPEKAQKPAKTEKSAKAGKPAKLKSQQEDSMFDSEGSYKLAVEMPKKEDPPKAKCAGCGAEVAANAAVCVKCGAVPATGKKYQPPKPKREGDSKGKLGQFIKVLLVLALLGAAAWAVQNFWLGK